MQGMNDRWTIDKRIPVSLIACFLAQTVGVFVWATKIDSRVEQLEKNQIPASVMAVTGEQLGAMKEKMNDIRGEIGGIKTDISGLKEEVRRSGFNGKR